MEKADRTGHGPCLQESNHRQHLLRKTRKLKQKFSVFLELTLVLSFIDRGEAKL